MNYKVINQVEAYPHPKDHHSIGSLVKEPMSASAVRAEEKEKIKSTEKNDEPKESNEKDKQDLKEGEEPRKNTTDYADFTKVPDAIFEKEAERQRSKVKQRSLPSLHSTLPGNLCMTIKIFYNEPFSKMMKGINPEAFFNVVVQAANKVFQFKGLRTNLKVTIHGQPKFVSDQTASQWSPNHKEPHSMEIYNKHIPNEPQVHNFIFFTTRAKIFDVAARSYLGTVCMSLPENLKRKMSVISYTDDAPRTGHVLAHELGHVIGIDHDFQESSTTSGAERPLRKSKSGQACTDVEGIMDYNQKRYTKWTECSYEDALSKYQELAAAGSFCLETACGQNSGPTPKQDNAPPGEPTPKGWNGLPRGPTPKKAVGKRGGPPKKQRSGIPFKQRNIFIGNRIVKGVFPGRVIAIRKPRHTLHGLGPKAVRVVAFRTMAQRNNKIRSKEEGHGNMEYQPNHEMSYDDEIVYGNSFVNQES